MITISLCMIVKDEADILARCLDSVAEIMDEIVIVDTGSADRTKEVAARYTDKIFDFTWINDFAAARNFAFSKAECDYIYSADADEVMDELNRKRFKELKKSIDVGIEVVQMYYVNQLKFGTVYNFDREYRPKLFKRNRIFTWIDPIHETIRLYPVVFDSEIEIIHQPKESHASRDFSVFWHMTESEKVLSKRLHNLYARELMIAGNDDDFLRAADYFEISVTNPEYELEQVKEAACIIARAARISNDTAKFFKFAMKDIASEGCSEICCELGEYYRARDDIHEAVVWFYNAAFETASILDIRCSKEIPLKALSECYKLLGMDEDAEKLDLP